MDFNQEFKTIKGNMLTLKLIETCVGDDKVIPFYYYDIYLKSISSPIGKISIRIGYNEHSYFNGNVGYEIDEAFRGNGYAKIAVMIAIPAIAIMFMAYKPNIDLIDLNNISIC